MKKILVLLLLCAAVPRARAYGPEGHEIVGAIADRLLANTPAGAKVSALLDGMTLEEAATIPDTIKAWDTNGVDNPKAQEYFSVHPKIGEQLRAFWKANPPTYDEKSPVPSHHWFHYTDVPLAAPFEKYGDGKAGRSQWDIVHMMAYCIRVLGDKEPSHNERAITKPIAVILLAHFVGDIHQPLHVGAEYFDKSGQPVNPDKATDSLGDEGGNSLRLELHDTPPPGESKHPRLHSFWDSDAVLANLPQFPLTMPKEERRAKLRVAEGEMARRLAEEEPRKRWQLPADLPLEKYPEAWANEILPIAREAHTRLRFEHVAPKLDHEQMVAAGEADEQSSQGISYRQWSRQVVLDELHRAGWRLADLLRKALNAAPNEKPETTPPSAPNESPDATVTPATTR
ncbi:MAG TPA: S1/P1 nuclease [Chthoniobacterales bacterium]|jgi:hypothetical protein